jgi:hypothetical protein
MKINLYHGAYLNSGDFLIRDSFVNLVKSIGVSIDKTLKYDEIDNIQIDDGKINILCGGPVLEPKFIKKISSLNDKFYAFGAGSYLIGHSKDLKIKSEIGAKRGIFRDISFRDALSKDLYGKDADQVTGCAASYHFTDYSDKSYKEKSPNIIAVSAPQRFAYFPYTLSLLSHLRHNGLEPHVLFNRGWQINERTSGITQHMTSKFVHTLQANGFVTRDSSGEYGMELYGEYRTHIGFRLHSHYYMLARKKHSMLLVEDSRGLGANNLFNLPSIFPIKFNVNDWRLNALPSKFSAAALRILDELIVKREPDRIDLNIIDDFLQKGLNFQNISETQFTLRNIGTRTLSSWLG